MKVTDQTPRLGVMRINSVNNALEWKVKCEKLSAQRDELLETLDFYTDARGADGDDIGERARTVIAKIEADK